MMDVDFQYELYNEWVESKEKITLAEFCYEKGRNDAINECITKINREHTHSAYNDDVYEAIMLLEQSKQQK